VTTSKGEKAVLAGAGAGGITFLLSSLFPNYSVLLPFNPDPTNGANPPPDFGTRLAWSILVGSVFSVLAYNM